MCLPRLSAPKLRRVGELLRQQGAAAENAVEMWLAGRLSVLESLTYGSVSPFSCVACIQGRVLPDVARAARGTGRAGACQPLCFGCGRRRARGPRRALVHASLPYNFVLTGHVRYARR